MATTTASPYELELLCSFCGKSQEQVAHLIAGPGPAICDECVHLCNDVLAGRRPEGIRSWDDQSDQELIATMVRVASLRHHVDRAVGRLARLLHSRGTTWTAIGAALGITRQSAWERFSEED
jgi:hypothetical protein